MTPYSFCISAKVQEGDTALRNPVMLPVLIHPYTFNLQFLYYAWMQPKYLGVLGNFAANLVRAYTLGWCTDFAYNTMCIVFIYNV